MQWLSHFQRSVTYGANTATSEGTTFTGNASANVKGTYVQFTASTTFTTQALMLNVRSSSSFFSNLIDIAIGAAASEQVLVSNLLYSSLAQSAQSYFFPCVIPKGTRIAMRSQGQNGGVANIVTLTAFSGAWGTPEYASDFTTYGTNTATSRATSIDPGAATNTKGAYSEITAATTKNHKGLLITIGNQANTARSTYTWLLDIAIGAGGSEQVIFANWLLASVSGKIVTPSNYYLPFAVARGTRIAARAQCNGNDATDRIFDVQVIGVS